MSTNIHHEVVFKASPERVYDALMNEKEHGTFTGGPAQISREAGGTFSCHGGHIVGRNIELVPNKRIVQAWRVATWPEGMYSMLRFELDGQGSDTKLVMDHAGFPDGERDHLDEGWKIRYWEPLKKFLA